MWLNLPMLPIPTWETLWIRMLIPFLTNNGTFVFYSDSLYLPSLNPIIKTMDKRKKTVFLLMGMEVLFMVMVATVILLLT